MLKKEEVMNRFRNALDDYAEKRWYRMYADEIVAGSLQDVRVKNKSLIMSIFHWSNSREPMNLFLSHCKDIGIEFPIYLAGEVFNLHDEYYINVLEENSNKQWNIFLCNELSENDSVEKIFREIGFSDEYLYKNMQIKIAFSVNNCCLHVILDGSEIITLSIMGRRKEKTQFYVTYKRIVERLQFFLDYIDYSIDVHRIVQFFMEIYDVSKLNIKTPDVKAVFDGTNLVEYENEKEQILIKKYENYSFEQCVVDGTTITFENASIKIDYADVKQVQQLITIAENILQQKKQLFIFD